MREQIVAAVLSSPDFLLLALILAIVSLVHGTKMLWKLFLSVEKTLQSAQGQFAAMAGLAMTMEIAASAMRNALVQALSLSFTLIAWLFWRTNRKT